MARRDRTVRVDVKISDLVPVMSNDGGYMSRRCVMCGEMGYERVSDYGYHCDAPLVDDYRLPGYHMSNDLKHKKSCVINRYIDKKTGKLKP